MCFVYSTLGCCLPAWQMPLGSSIRAWLPLAAPAQNSSRVTRHQSCPTLLMASSSGICQSGSALHSPGAHWVALLKGGKPHRPVRGFRGKPILQEANAAKRSAAFKRLPLAGEQASLLQKQSVHCSRRRREGTASPAAVQLAPRERLATLKTGRCCLCTHHMKKEAEMVPLL